MREREREGIIKSGEGVASAVAGCLGFKQLHSMTADVYNKRAGKGRPAAAWVTGRLGDWATGTGRLGDWAFSD